MVLGAVLAAIGLVTLALVAMPWRVALALEAQGAPSGAWVLAGGAQLFGCAASVARARGTPVVIELRAFGRRLWSRTGPPAPRPAAPPAKSRLTELVRRVDPIDLLLFLMDERRRVAVRDLDATVRLGLADVALAGEIAGVLAVLSALGSPFGRLRHEIDWTGREHLDASVSLSIRFSPALLVWDTLRFAARARAQRN
jgi:hypothetical protein